MNLRLAVAGLATALMGLVGCGGSGSPSSGPAAAAERHFAALGARNGQTVCDATTTTWHKELMSRIYVIDPSALSSCAKAVEISEQSLGTDALAPLLHAKVKVLSQTSNSAVVQRVGGTDRLTLQRAGGLWLITHSSS